MRIFTAIMVAAAVLATSVVSVRLHLHVVQLRYRVEGLESQRVRAEREMRLAQAELEAAKAPRRLMERWAEMHGGMTSATTRPAARAAAPATPVEPDPELDAPPAEVVPEDPATADAGREDRR